MGFVVGDSVFSKNGLPGVVVDRDKQNQSFKVDQTPEKVRKSNRHGYINGLKQEERQRFLSILDQVSKEENPEQKLKELGGQIATLKEDPRNFKLVQYLESEFFHIMNSSGIRPKSYKVQAEDM